MSIATSEVEELVQSRRTTVTKTPSQRKKRWVSKYELAGRLMRKFPNTWICLSKMKNRNTAQSFVWQLKHDSSPALPASEFGFRIHEVNGEWWIQAIYFGEDD